MFVLRVSPFIHVFVLLLSLLGMLLISRSKDLWKILMFDW